MKKIDELIKEMCPNGVKFDKLADLCKSQKKGTLKTNELKNDGKFPVINSGRTFYGYYDLYNNEGNTFTVAARGEYAGFVNYIEKNFWAGGLCYPYTSKDENIIMTKFIYYYLKSKEKDIMDTLVSRGSIPAINKNDLEKVRIPVPPLEVQCEIVHILDYFTLVETELETELEEELKARKKQYEYYRDKLLNYNENEIHCDSPYAHGYLLKNIKYYKLSEIANIYDGTHQTPKYKNEGIPFISVENINNIYNSKKYISIEDYNKYKIKPKINDIFMTRIGSIGKCAVFYKQEDIAYYVSLALIRPNQNIVNSFYLKYLIESIIGKKELRKRTLVNAVPIKINKDDIGKIKLPIPPLEEQKKIVVILDKFEKIANDISEGLSAEIEARQKQYEYYRDKILNFKELKIEN